MNSSLKNRKSSVNKTKLKKTIKNIICRPDPVFWPIPSENEEKMLEDSLVKYKVNIPEFKKIHWKKLKLIPKEQRPKPPKIKKVEGLLFGITECDNAVKNKECVALIIEAGVNPRTIVQPLIETCSFVNVPVVCLNNLRKISFANFGIATSALGIKHGCLPELSKQIFTIAKIPPCTEEKLQQTADEIEGREKVESKDDTKTISIDVEDRLSSRCLYLYRTNKKSRVFTPPIEGAEAEPKKFTAQDFIIVNDKNISVPNNYMKMILKGISSNPNRNDVKQEKVKQKTTKI